MVCVCLLVLLLAACGGEPSEGEEVGASDGSSPRSDEPVAAVGPVQPSPGCGSDEARAAEPGLALGTTSTHPDGATRAVQEWVPSAHDGVTPVPLVLDLHGLMSSGDFQRTYSRMDEHAEQEGYLALHPMATPVGQTAAWQVGAEGSVSSVGYLRALLDEVGEQRCVDEARVYVAGMSNGGLMASRLACDLSERVAAVATVAGTFLPERCEPGRPVPWLAVHGTDDDVLPYDGGVGPRLDPRFIDVTRNGGTLLGAVPETMAAVAEQQGCEDEAAEDLADDVRVRTWAACEQGSEVALVTVEGGSHSWPGGLVRPEVEDLPGQPTQQVSATELAWAFFEGHSLDQP